jgi:hypothetical protein
MISTGREWLHRVETCHSRSVWRLNRFAGAELLRASERAILSVAEGDLVGRIQNGSVEPYSLSAGFGAGLRGRAALPKAWRSADTPDP